MSCASLAHVSLGMTRLVKFGGRKLARVGLDAGACHGTIELKSKLNPHRKGRPRCRPGKPYNYFASALLKA